MNTAKKSKSQTPKPGTPVPKSILKTPKPQTPQPLATPAKTPATSTPLKSILKKPKPLDEPAKIPTPAQTKPSGIAPSQKKPSPKSSLKSGKASPAKSLKKPIQPKEDSDDDDEDVGAFDLSGSDDSEEGFDVASQIRRALGEPKVKQTKPTTTKTAAKTAAKPNAKAKAPIHKVPVLSDSEDDENAGVDMSSDEEEVAPSQMKNWKALASKTLTMDKGPTKKQAGESAFADLGAGLPSVPRPGKAGKTEEKKATKGAEINKPAQGKTKDKPAAPGKPTTTAVEQPTTQTKKSKSTNVPETKPTANKPTKQKAADDQRVADTQVVTKKLKLDAPPKTKEKASLPASQKMALFDDSDDEAALDFDGAEGDEGDEEQEAAISRALHKPGDFSDLLGGKGGPMEDDEFEGDEGDKGEGGESSEDYENEDLPFEKAAKRLAAMEARVEKEANEEMQTNLQEIQTFKLPSGQEIEQEKLIAPDLTLLNQRIQDVLFTLSDFRKKKEADRSRTEYMECLARDLTTYYGYLPELIDRFLEMFSPAEAVEFLMANEAQRPVTLRVNSLKTRRGDLIQALSKRGIHVEPLADWTKVGCKVTMSKLPLGATPEYMAGYYVLQSAASFLPVMALAPQEHERVLDMCASPGGKSTYIAALMKNTGLLVANDANTKRLPSLTGNIHRLGVRNSVVTNFDGRKLKKHFGLFDRILLDAPCSGLGVIAKDPSVKTTKTNKDIQRSSHIQKELALAAIDMLDAESRTGGYLVYSTCSISVEENEEVVDYILSHRHVKIVETNIPFGVIGMTRYRTKQFHPSVALSRRFYPHVHNMDGFFVCKMKKLADGAKTSASPSTQEEVEDTTTEVTKDGAATASGAPSPSPAPGNGVGKAKKKKEKNAASSAGGPAPQSATAPPSNAAGRGGPKKEKQAPQQKATPTPKTEKVPPSAEGAKPALKRKKAKPTPENGAASGPKTEKAKKAKVESVPSIPTPQVTPKPVGSIKKAKPKKTKPAKV